MDFRADGGTKKAAGMLNRSSIRKIRGNPARAPYSPEPSGPATSNHLSTKEFHCRNQMKGLPRRAPRGQRFGVRSRPARTRFTVSKTLLSGHFQVGSCCCCAVAATPTSVDIAAEITTSARDLCRFTSPPFGASLRQMIATRQARQLQQCRTRALRLRRS